LRSFESRHGAALDDETPPQIHSIKRFNSIYVLRKRSQAQKELGARVVVGAHAITAQALMSQHRSRMVLESQATNAWSRVPPLPEDEFPALRSQRKGLLHEGNALRTQVASWQANTNTANEALLHTRQELRHAQKTVESTRQALTQAQAHEVRVRVATLGTELHAFRASTSWRLPARLRKLAKLLRGAARS
jgi:hypothetical protein